MMQVGLSAYEYGGRVEINNKAGEPQVGLGVGEDGGVLGIYNKAGEPQVTLGSDETGGILNIQNKTGEDVVQLYADEYGNGKVGAFNRKGKGRTLQPGNLSRTMTIYNLLGQNVIRPVDQVQSPGCYESVWNGTNITGAGVASGIYLFRIVSGSGYIETKRMTLLK